MPSASQPEFQFDLSGGILCLDFANTVSRRDDPKRRKEHLHSYDDLISFATQSGQISPKESASLREFAGRHKRQAQELLAKAIALRETVFRAFVAIAQHRPPSAVDIQQINDAALEALQHRELIRSNDAYRWSWIAERVDPLESLLRPVGHSAAELLTSQQLQAVRYCEAPDCEWLFLDNSRNRSRRWCDMKSCGNRQKARRHYQRSHE